MGSFYLLGGVFIYKYKFMIEDKENFRKKKENPSMTRRSPRGKHTWDTINPNDHKDY